VHSHTASARRRGYDDEQLAALREPGGRRDSTLFDPTERAILRFTGLLTSRPGNIDAQDLTALGEHLDQEQVVELVVAIATANWTNRVNDGLRTPLP
jgi:alkylhydroperoxidase family enzyme